MRLESVIASEPQAPVRLLSTRLSTRIVGSFLYLAGAVVIVLKTMYLSPNLEAIGGAMAFGMAWAALRTATLPRVKGTIDAHGLELVDNRWAWLFYAPRRRVAWDDVLEIVSRRQYRKYGTFVTTRIKVRAEAASEDTRWFSIDSYDPGYDEFLAALNARIDRTRVTIGGLGIEPKAVLAPPRAISARAFVGVLVVTFLSSGAILWIFTTLARR